MSSNLKVFSRGFMLASAVALMAGCISVTDKKSVNEDQFSGYLSSYEKFEYIPERNAFVFRMQEIEPGKKIYLSDFDVYGPEGSYTGELAQQASDYMRDKIEDILERKGLLADSLEGEDTVQLRMAITGTEKSNEDIKAYNFVPVSFAFTAGQVATGNRATFIEAAMEAEILDQQSNLMVAVVQKGIGKTEKRSGDELTFDDLVPIMDVWLVQFQEMVEESFL